MNAETGEVRPHTQTPEAWVRYMVGTRSINKAYYAANQSLRAAERYENTRAIRFYTKALEHLKSHYQGVFDAS